MAGLRVFEINTSNSDKKNTDTSNLAKKKTDLNAKITEIEGKLPCITGLTNSSALTAVENKIASSLVKKKRLSYKN